MVDKACKERSISLECFIDERFIMDAWIIQTGHRISPFGDPPSEAQFAMGTVGSAVKVALEKRGLTIRHVDRDAPLPPFETHTVVLADHCYVSDKCLGDFLSLAFGSAEVLRLALANTPSSDYTRPTSSIVAHPFAAEGPAAKPSKSNETEQAATDYLAYDCFFIPKGHAPQATTAAGLLSTLQTEATAQIVTKREIGVEIRLPLLGNPEDTRMIFPITSTVACHVETWVHILWLNHLAFGIRFMELARTHKLWALGCALRAFPPSLPRLMKASVYRGKNVEIHPSAYVEASILGDGVKIGPRACVRNSILGPGVEVADHASVIACTMGDHSYITPKSFFVWSTAYPQAVISNYKMQMSVVGKGAASSTWAGLIDAKFQGTIEIMKNGEKVSTERQFLGSCLGHGAFVGAKALLHPGRELPNGTYLTMRPDELIQTIPDDLKPGIPVVRDGGTLITLEELKKRSEALNRQTEQN